MAVIADHREKNPIIKELADDVMLLDYADSQTGHSYSYDLHVIAGVFKGDAMQFGGMRELAFERKTWDDFMQSFFQGRLIDQLAIADGIVIEINEEEIEENAPDGPARMVKDYWNAYNSVKNHIVHISANIWTLITTDAEDTMKRMRYLEKRVAKEDWVPIRPNYIKLRGDTVQDRILNALPRINPYSKLPDGRRKGEALAAECDWELVLRGLNPQAWMKVPGSRVGPRTIDDIARNLRERKPATNMLRRRNPFLPESSADAAGHDCDDTDEGSS